MDLPPPPPPVDLLSSLAEHLQDEILRRLDLRDAVRTSLLSRTWRWRWETIPGLALSFPDGTPPSVVDRVLLRYVDPSVSRFAAHVDSEDEASNSHVDGWLIALSRRRVESISISSSPGVYTAVHSCIFSCHRLVSLTLKRCSIPPLPNPGGGFAGFPVLKELYLKFVEFADDGESQFWAMLRASPKLRVLFLESGYVPDDTDRVIEAPNLHTLWLVSEDFEWRFGDLPCLQYASIDMAGLQYSEQSFIEFLTAVSQVEELIINIQECDFEMNGHPLTFPNLKSMELSIDFIDKDGILLIFFLLRSSPNLEKLKIEPQQPIICANRKFLNSQWTDGMCANLQVVQITSAQGWLPLSLMKLILSKASRLCTLFVDACPASQDDRLNKLLNYRRASPQAQVLFKDQLEKINFCFTKFAEKRLN